MNKYALASNLSCEATEKLLSLGVTVVNTGINPSVDNRIAFHSDISFVYLGNNNVFAAKEMSEANEKLRELCFNVIENTDFLGKEYPFDAPLNVADTGKFLICNVDTTAPFVLQYFKKQGRQIVPVSQGYTKCSVAVVSEDAVITDDESVYKSCKNHLDVLKISKGYVKLDGFEYGFIGGASGKISPDILAFNGKIENHPDFNLISDFALKHNVIVLSLTDDFLTDIGSIIPLYMEV